MNRMPFSNAEAHLKAVDNKLALVIDEVGTCKLNSTDRNRFDVLASSIIGQQLSIKAAHTIKKRVADLVGLGNVLEPGKTLSLKVQRDKLDTHKIPRNK